MEERKSTLDFLRKIRDRVKSLTSKKSQEINLPDKIEGELYLPNLKEDPKTFLDANTKLEELHLDPLEAEEKGKLR